MTHPDAFESWFTYNNWRPFDFQRRVWSAYRAGLSGLLHAPTGSGKTLAAFGGAVIERLSEGPTTITYTSPLSSRARPMTAESSKVIWVTPMRALATDTAHALQRVVNDLKLNWSVELRTSDTSASTRKRQKDRLPTVLVTTPESLSVLMSYPDAPQKLTGLSCCIVDEWHELLSTKRGTQTELALARLRMLNPTLRTWGMSATIENLTEATAALVGHDAGTLIESDIRKRTIIESIIPESIERFPWGGHMGLRMVSPVIDAINASTGCTLVFTNTRAQCELWYRAMRDASPAWMDAMAIHHGSLDRKLRQKVEQHVREGLLRVVVCTSSLDLGVDFSAVDQVIQIGSPKGVGRLLQRAGRSGHRPGEVSRVLCVPTHAFELIEFSAAREGAENRRVEPREPLNKPLDVLAQHVVTVACGGGFDEAELLREIKTSYAYKNITDDEWRWTLDFVQRGGATLSAYPHFARVRQNDEGRWVVSTEPIARVHRIGIGTINSEGVLALVTTGGKRLGTVEESYVSKLKPGDSFVFAGRALVMVGIRQMTAKVKLATKMQGSVPVWAGGRFPLSTQLADAVRQRIEWARDGVCVDEEMLRLMPVLALQKLWSHLPAANELLIEKISTREGTHHFLFPLLGRLVHEGLGAVIGHRIKKMFDTPVTASYTDYALEMLCPGDLTLTENDWRTLLSPTGVVDDLLECLNAGELTRRQFRDIARVAGLVLATSPGAPKTVRQLQASSELFFDVFTEFDPENLLLKQARREVLERQLEVTRLTDSLERTQRSQLVLRSPGRLTPMAFPVWAQRISSQTLRVEDASSRIERMILSLEKSAKLKASQ